ncbi:hypothetical protein M0R45_016879 [Rubus argutus]|uniref:Exonuclease V n=1 Tax=Rubus argutus TaxID=59490 RepID=A0AAW1XTY3_RUBAR
MTESPSESLSDSLFDHHINKDHHPHLVPQIPIEIVSDEEMALLEAALVAARSSFSAIPSIRSSHVRSIPPITVVSKRRFSGCSGPDIEDSGGFRSTQKKTRLADSFLHRFRKKGLAVTDFTATEWCEKQMDARHAKLEEEVVTRVKVDVKSIEDRWALKLLNFITGINQLLFEGLTRELPLFAEGVWMVGVIDEIQMPATVTQRNPLLVDTKTRVKDTLPAEPQQRNGRLQLMCYKYIWDNLVADKFPSNEFFDFFSLNADCDLSEEIREIAANSGFPAKTLDDVVRYYRNTWSMLPPAHDKLLLRVTINLCFMMKISSLFAHIFRNLYNCFRFIYELQKDHSLIGEDEFAYDSDWVKRKIQDCLEFWLGEREATYTPEEERWKCRFCQFASACPAKNAKNSNLPT